MVDKKEVFIQAIHHKVIVKVKIHSYDKGIIERKCIPFDYGPSRGNLPGGDRYHFYDLNSPEGSHTLSILPEQLLEIEMTTENFDPANFVKWKPSWFIPRDWGKYS